MSNFSSHFGYKTKFPLKNNSHSFASLTIEQITKNRAKVDKSGNDTKLIHTSVVLWGKLLPHDLIWGHASDQSAANYSDMVNTFLGNTGDVVAKKPW